VTRATGQIAEGHFDQQLPEDRGDELGQLSRAINRMAARLSGFVTGQKRFLGDIAHELCAPIARMQFGLGILEQRARDSEQESQRAAVEDVQDEMRHMSSLVAELLSFSKAGMEAGHRPLVPVNVNDTAREAVAREAHGQAVEIHVEIHIEPALTALADPQHLFRSLSNLVRNAIRYGGEAGPVTLSARCEGREIVIAVADSGPGLPGGELERVFTPFYRPDASRNRESGGAGLGLAIVKSCIEACGGRVQCRNRRPSGLEVEIRLCAAPNPFAPGGGQSSNDTVGQG
jgi:two-component system sensor histidine kinase CpxA